MLDNLLIYRLAIINTLAAALAFWAHVNGLVVPVFANDVSFLGYAIVVLFAIGLVSTFVRAGKVSSAVNDMKAHGYAMAYQRRKAAKMNDKNAHLADLSGWLQVLGLLGTVIGFSVALEGHGTDNPDAIVAGLQTAIGTTILGGFLSLLTSVNFRMLETATAGYREDVVV